MSIFIWFQQIWNWANFYFDSVEFLQYAGNIFWKAICLSYVAFIYYDRETGVNGGRGIG